MVYASFMVREPNVGDLREILWRLRDEIEKLEWSMQIDPSKHRFATRQLIGEIKIQEVLLLAKLAELETKQ
jgi:hypothetical protein